MSNSEDYSFLKAMMPSTVDNKFQERTWNYAESTESSYTNSQCSFDLSTFANSKNAQIWSTGFIVLPLMIVMTMGLPPAGGNAVSVGFDRSDYAVCLKSFYSNLINSVQVILGNKTLNTSTANIHIYNSLKQLSEASVQSERTKGHLGLFIDDAEAFAYNPTGTGNGAYGAGTAKSWKMKGGNGLLCNFWKSSDDAYAQDNEALGSNTGKPQNEGGKKRCEECADNANYYANLLSTNNASSELRDYSFYQGENSANGIADIVNATRTQNYQVWYKNVVIRLSDILDLFGELDMVKGGYFKINLTLNLGSVVVRTANNTPTRPGTTIAGYVSATSPPGALANINVPLNVKAPLANNIPVGIYTGDTNFQQACPLLVNPSAINVIGGNAGTALSQNVIFGLYMGSVGASVPGYTQQSTYGVPNHPLGKARLYLESVVLDEESNLKLFDSIGAVKNIDFNDVVYNNIVNVASNSTVSQQVGHSLKGAHTLIVVPRISSDVHGALTGAQQNAITAVNASVNGFSQWLSPFYPMMGAPLSINKVQVVVNGKSLYPSYLDYTYQHYIENWNTWRTTNGNVTDGALQSGLLTKQQWEIFRTYVFTWPNEDNNVPQNVNLTFMNNSAVNASYETFIVCRKSIKLNTLSGQVEEANF